ncbi:MAG: carbon-nitrogen hydrolase family protein [Proteobacteria bacterium]|nr:carbon-nitrogen hydrolase family protein [Pseudomonadota bacterium]
MDRKIRTALIQHRVFPDPVENLDRVESLLRRAADLGADLAVLPEMFNMPYDMDLVPDRAEAVPDGPTGRRLSLWARSLGLVLVGGSVAERGSAGRFYNTATLWGTDGELLAKHRKVHLFDVDLPGGVSFKESSILSAGDRATVVPILGLRLGLAVCYDVRFPELFRLMALAGAEMTVLPGAFNQVSGPAHWELMLRGRAVENTMYMAGVSGLPDGPEGYQAWGHSMLVDPFGEVIIDLGREEGLAVAEVDPERLRDVRARLPLLAQRRTLVYRLWPADREELTP